MGINDYANTRFSLQKAAAGRQRGARGARGGGEECGQQRRDKPDPKERGKTPRKEGAGGDIPAAFHREKGAGADC